MKFAIVGDLHLGATNKKSPIGNAFVKGQHAYIDQMISEWKEADVTHVVFLGDIFDNERFIATDVMDYALRLFRDKLADFKVIVIAGNHDMRYTNTSEVCSVSFLDLIPHVTVYDAKIGVEHFFGREWIFVPWILQDNMDKVNKCIYIFYSKWSFSYFLKKMMSITAKFGLCLFLLDLIGYRVLIFLLVLF